jgi:hypothetical protein
LTATEYFVALKQGSQSCDHDDICCKSCIADEHRTCGKIKPLDVAAKGVKSAIMFEDFASEVKYLIDTASKVRERLVTITAIFDGY